MTKTLPLQLGNSDIGTVTCSFDGIRAVFHAVCTENPAGIARAYVKGHGTPLLIGVLSPCGDEFSASKTVSKTALASLGISFEGISAAYATVSEKRTEPQSAHHTWVLPPANICDISNDSAILALLRSDGSLVSSPCAPSRLAVPLIPGRPFPRPDVLCLMTGEEIDGALYAVIGISKSGAPRQV